MKTETRLSELRCERKYVPEGLSRAQVESLIRLHPAGFRERYPARLVNNIYLDSGTFQHFIENRDGVSDRAKARIRWYGDLRNVIDQPRLEVKVRRGEAMRKESFRLPPFDTTGRIDLETPMRLLRMSELPAAVKARLAVLRPTLVNRYRRSYYESSGGIRLTLDSDIAHLGLLTSTSAWRDDPLADRGTVLELKYAIDREREASDIAKRLPFRIARNSKYASGIALLYG